MLSKEPMRFEAIPQKYDELLRLAKHIASFKTPEMEITFAKLIQKHINPRMATKDVE